MHKPIVFQGHLKKKNYFEGWYYKMVSPDGLYSLALIPGISLNKGNSHAFIQIFVTRNHKDLKTVYISYPLNQFSVQNQPFELNINQQIFKEDGIDIQIDQNDLSMQGKLSFENRTEIKTSIFSPSIMGYFSYFKFMECYHGVISMNHLIKGRLLIDNQEVDFTGGKGYMEKDWGKSFPKAYVWMQSNHFKNPNTSFMFSQATIPFMGFEFHGLIVNLIVGGKEYRFATYNRGKVKQRDIFAKEVFYEISKGKYTLIVEGKNDQTIDLVSPEKGAMVNRIKEGLSGKIKLQLFENDYLIYEDIGTHGGLEIMMESEI
ncbi:MAG: tocopherol cyclase family protein [Candidatus Izemoplasmatales bacterium]